MCEAINRQFIRVSWADPTGISICLPPWWSVNGVTRIFDQLILFCQDQWIPFDKSKSRNVRIWGSMKSFDAASPAENGNVWNIATASPDNHIMLPNLLNRAIVWNLVYMEEKIPWLNWFFFSSSSLLRPGVDLSQMYNIKVHNNIIAQWANEQCKWHKEIPGTG